MNAARTTGLVAGALLCVGALALLLHDSPEPAVSAPAPVATASTTTPVAPTTPHVDLKPPEPEQRRERGPVVLRTLRGLVRDAATDTPIPRARVAARDPRSGGAVLGAETDWEGRFSLEAPDGDLEVMAVAEGWLLAEQPTLAPAATRDRDVIVRLDAGVPVRGRVTLAPGTQAWLPKKIEVCLLGPSARYVGSFEPVFTEADGSFELPGAPLGPGHAVVASAPGWAKARVDLQPITGPVDGVVLELSQLIVVTGNVVLPDGKPATGATVGARTRGESWSTRTDDAGAFRLEAQWSDEFLLVATAPGFAGTSLAVGPRTGRTGITLRLGVTCPIETTPFLDAQGKPLRGTLSLEPTSSDDPHEEEPVDEPLEVTFDETGRPQVDALAPGRWSIHMLEKASEDEMRAWILEVEVAPGPPVKLAFDARGPKGKVEGRVLGAPQDDLVQVEVRPATPPREGFGFLAAVRAAANGSFAVGDVPPGTYGVFASWEGGEARADVEVREGATTWVDVGP